MLKIGVSACFMYPDPNRTVFGHKTLLYLEKDMSLYLSRKDVMPILIPDLPEEQLIPYLEMMDGFVFQGGADIAPESYGAEPIENKRWPGDRHRDLYELSIMDYAFKNQKPIFAICRGFQLANVYCGGTLFQDLSIQTQTAVKHRDAEIYDRVNHSVALTAQSIFPQIYEKATLAPEFTVNSVHHQGVQTLGKNLVVDAVSKDDQLVEAFHHQNPEQNFLLAVQWHPEFSHTLGDSVIDPDPLYQFFLQAVKRKKTKA